MEKTGKKPTFVNGLRVTDEETMEVAEMVLGKVNKGLVQLVESLGVRAIGLSGKDGGLLRAEKKLSEGKDIGFGGCGCAAGSSGERFPSGHLPDRAG